MGNFYIVATPIGNLEDITLRAIRVLKEVDFVFAEDTRTTGILFKKYDISTRLISYNAVNHKQKNPEILKLLSEGRNVALVSDAGTPSISDPGFSAVSFVRAEAKEVNIIPIPGASALTAFVSALGVGTHAFTFYGFLPHKNGRQKLLKEMMQSEKSSLFYESTHRLLKCLNEIASLQQENDEEGRRKVAIGKELTKIYEDIMIDTPENLIKILEEDPKKQKGEFVLMII